MQTISQALLLAVVSAVPVLTATATAREMMMTKTAHVSYLRVDSTSDAKNLYDVKGDTFGPRLVCDCSGECNVVR